MTVIGMTNEDPNSSPNGIGANKISRLAKPVAEDSPMPLGNSAQLGSQSTSK
jgi:hypothetical protein